MRVEMWADIACPWCLLGKRQLEEAIRRTGLDVAVEARAFELDPYRRETAPAKGVLEKKLGPERVASAHGHLRNAGARLGIRYDFARQLVANTFDAHRVHALAKARGRGAEVFDRMMVAYHEEGADLADHATIQRLATEAGLDANETSGVLASDAYAREVRAEQAQAIGLGIRGVPFFLVEGRLGVSGAQPVETMERALRLAAHRGPAADA